MQPVLPPLPPIKIPNTGLGQALTQLLAQFPSKPFPSAPQTFSAFTLSVMLSTIPFLSKQLKYASLASQHRALCVRSGAMGAPSVEIRGVGRVGVEEPNRPIVNNEVEGEVLRDLFASEERVKRGA